MCTYIIREYPRATKNQYRGVLFRVQVMSRYGLWFKYICGALDVETGLGFLFYTSGNLPALQSMEDTVHFYFFQNFAPLSLAKKSLYTQYHFCQMTA
jgi:hypothetical protein